MGAEGVGTGHALDSSMVWLRRSVSVLAVLPTALLLGACDPEVDAPDDEGATSDTDEADTDEADTDSAEEPSGPAPTPTPKPAAAVPCELEAWGGYACTTDEGSEGTNYCLVVDGQELYTECSTEPPACVPGDGIDQGCAGSICAWDGEALYRFDWSEPDCITPLVLDFEGAGVEFAPAAAASFDLSPDGTCASTDWPTAPWLALDRDGDGIIRDGSELFGSATQMSTGGYASDGFAALRELDSNRDGKITAEDARFSELVLWEDLDDDRVGAFAELRPLSEMSLVSIDLDFDRRATCDGQGNCGLERAGFEYRTAAGSVAVGEVVDVHLPCR
jgi:hypothetical protein